jgi:SAM-dependent methyltransferase
MAFSDKVLPLLCCQSCNAGFEFKHAEPSRLGRGEFGVLTCKCASYPVIDGIPVIQQGRVGMFEHTTGQAQTDGATPTELVQLIESGQSDDALMRCLAPPSRIAWLRLLGWRLSTSSPAARLNSWQSKRAITEVLESRDSITARDVLRFFFGYDALGGPDVGDYFILRFGQPRWVAAVALLERVASGPKPVLDVACGVGHLEHYLTKRANPVDAIGVDINFYHVWIARHWIAPHADYVCCNVTEGLPFQSGTFSATMVSDAYHYFPQRDRFNSEIDRVGTDGPIVLTRVGNRAMMPNEGSEVSLREYLLELGDRETRAFSEESLVRDYLARRNPLDRQGETPEWLEHCKWFSFVSNVSSARPAPDRTDGKWPHSVGRIGVNPIYGESDSASGTALRFRFPRPWYAYENHQMLEYHPRRAELDSEDRRLLRAGGWSGSLEQLLRQFVLIGLPDRF